jgi:PTS system nitrogen regulatory IIA component
VTLAELLAPERVLPRLRAADKPRLLAEFGRRAAGVVGIDAAEITAALAAREALGSTGVGAGIAVPHAALPGLGGTVAFLIRLERPIDFAAIDGRPVDLVFLLLGPPEGRTEHLAALAAAARRLRDPATATALRAAASPEAMRAAFLAEPAG